MLIDSPLSYSPFFLSYPPRYPPQSPLGIPHDLSLLLVPDVQGDSVRAETSLLF